MAIVAQLVRASDCGPEGRGFDSRQSPHLKNKVAHELLFCFSAKFSCYLVPNIYTLADLSFSSVMQTLISKPSPELYQQAKNLIQS